MKVKRLLKGRIKERIRSTNLFRVINPYRYPFYRRYYPQFNFEEVRRLNTISHKFKFAYFHIPKAANSTIRLNLFYGAGNVLPVEITNRKDVFGKIDSYFDFTYLLSEHQVKELMAEYFKFTFVRHPVSRIVSAYLEKIYSNKIQKQVVAKALNKQIDEGITWDEFLSYLELGGYKDDMHWARQTDLLTMPLNKFDFIGKVENFNQDFEFVQKSVFGKIWEPAEWRFHSSEKLRGKLELADKDLSRIYKIYERDFDNLKYVKNER